jgi:hypothetical protein
MRAGGAFLEPGASPRHDAEDGPLLSLRSISFDEANGSVRRCFHELTAAPRRNRTRVAPERLARPQTGPTGASLSTLSG